MVRLSRALPPWPKPNAEGECLLESAEDVLDSSPQGLSKAHGHVAKVSMNWAGEEVNQVSEILQDPTG